MDWILGIFIVCYSGLFAFNKYIKHKEKMAEIDSRTCECKGKE